MIDVVPARPLSPALIQSPVWLCCCSHSTCLGWSWVPGQLQRVGLLLSQITMPQAVPQFRILPPSHMDVVVFIHLLSPRAGAGSIRSSGLLCFVGGS